MLADVEHQAGSNQPEDPGLPTLTVARVRQREEATKASIEQIKGGSVLGENIIVKTMALGMVDQRPKNIAFVIVASPSTEQGTESPEGKGEQEATAEDHPTVEGSEERIHHGILLMVLGGAISMGGETIDSWKSRIVSRRTSSMESISVLWEGGCFEDVGAAAESTRATM